MAIPGPGDGHEGDHGGLGPAGRCRCHFCAGPQGTGYHTPLRHHARLPRWALGGDYSSLLCLAVNRLLLEALFCCTSALHGVRQARHNPMVHVGTVVAPCFLSNFAVVLYFLQRCAGRVCGPSALRGSFPAPQARRQTTLASAPSPGPSLSSSTLLPQLPISLVRYRRVYCCCTVCSRQHTEYSHRFNGRRIACRD
jgi:hypothetical protein